MTTCLECVFRPAGGRSVGTDGGTGGPGRSAGRPIGRPGGGAAGRPGVRDAVPRIAWSPRPLSRTANGRPGGRAAVRATGRPVRDASSCRTYKALVLRRLRSIRFCLNYICGGDVAVESRTELAGGRPAGGVRSSPFASLSQRQKKDCVAATWA